MLSKQLNKWIS